MRNQINKVQFAMIFGLLTILTFGGVLAFAKTNKVTKEMKPYKTGFAPVNGIKMYYAMYGKKDGVPLLLLHGGGSTIESTFAGIIPFLAKNHRVIGIDEQAHGRTEDRDRVLRFDTAADDVNAFLTHMKIDKADIFGFSNGASIAMQLAIKYPDKVRKLVFASSMSKKSGAPGDFWEFIKKGDISMMPQPLKDAFLKVNPDPAKLQLMFDRDAERMRNFKDTSDQDVKSIKAETLILAGDRDVVTLDHTVELSKLIPNSRVMVFPAGHGDYMEEVSSTQQPRKLVEFTAGWIEEFLRVK